MTFYRARKGWGMGVMMEFPVPNDRELNGPRASPPPPPLSPAPLNEGSDYSSQ
jgi:hypothetical protein